MGYFLTTEPENAPRAISRVSPKTHTPDPRVKERGHRYYSPEIGRWASRDPIGERGWKVVAMRSKSKVPKLRKSEAVGIYDFVRNTPTSVLDPLGLMAIPQAPSQPGLSPCEEAQKKLHISSNNSGGETVCHNGKVIGCVWNKDSKSYHDYPGLMKCMQEHEDAHVSELGDVKCPPCGTYHILFTSTKAQQKSECPKYQAELNCLATRWERFKCRRWARLYFDGVFIGGGGDPGYDEKQAKACEPCCCR